MQSCMFNVGMAGGYATWSIMLRGESLFLSGTKLRVMARRSFAGRQDNECTIAFVLYTAGATK